ncbi:hypothetical protein AAFN60_14070 [Roseibacillus persicicus]|uniref:hypothetical protein n=1 Tax=Roseibacillus persicicus TaxID=454148 RepID=UPI00398BB778
MNSLPKLTFRHLLGLSPALSLVAQAAPLPIINPSFESGLDGDSSLTPIAGWTDSSATEAGFFLQDGTGGGSFPQDPSEPGAGLLYLSANRLAGAAGAQPATSTLSQEAAIDSSDLALVQSGDAFLNLSFLYSDTDNNDSATVTVDYLDSTGELIATATTGELPNVAPNGTPYDPVNAPWTLSSLIDPVPTGAVSLRINISTNRTGGSATNLHFDLFSAEITNEDSDGDGLPDDYELTLINANPNDAVTDLSHVAGPNDSFTTDFDNDGLSDSDEYNEFTDPLDPDTDDDGLLDGVETFTSNYQSPSDTGTDPLAEDSDLDGFNDGQEVVYGSDPNEELSLPGSPVAIVNGGFEESLVTTSLIGDPVSSGNFPGWTTLTNDAWVADGFEVGSTADPGFSTEGLQFLTMNRQSPNPDIEAATLEGGNAATMSVQQTVDISALATDIDNEPNSILISLDVFDSDPSDLGVVEMRFLDASGTDLGRQASFASRGNVGNWQRLTFPAYPPANTRSVHIVLSAQNLNDNLGAGVGTVRNIAFDQVSLRILSLDADADGMADDWELSYGLDPQVPEDAADQSDADALDNLAEFQAGTNPLLADTDGDGFDDDVELSEGSDPLDANSFPIDAPLLAEAIGLNASGEFEIRASGLDVAKSYRLLRSSDLLDFTLEVQSKQPSSENEIFTDTTPPVGQAFYLVEEIQPD